MKEEIFKRIDALAEKLGVAATKLWQVLVAQARVEAIQSIFWAVVCGVIAYFSIRFLLAAIYKCEKAEYSEEGKYIAGIIVFAITTVCSVIAFFVNAALIATPLLNPEYWALQQLLSVVK